MPVRDRHRKLEIISSVLAAVSFLLVLARIIARKPSLSDMLGRDDIIIILAFIFGFPLAIIQYYLGAHGLGRDIWTLSFDDITEVLRLFYLAEIFYLTTTILTKVSILFFYLRVFTNPTFRLVVWGIIATCMAFFVAFTFPLIFQCAPVSYAWTRWDGEHSGRCINIAAGIFSHAAINMALDLIVLALPLPLLYKLQLTYSLRGKIHISIMFSFGLVVTIISALRLQTLVVFLDSSNATYDFFGAALWSSLETYIGIICACLPATKVFFFRIAPRWFGLSTIGSSRDASAGQSPQRGPRSWATSSKGSSTYPFSKPPQAVTATISPTFEEAEGDFLPLQGVGSESDLSKRTSWVVTGKFGLPLQKFGSPRSEGHTYRYDTERAAESNKKWPLEEDRIPT